MKLICISAALLLAGCASVTANERGGVVEDAVSAKQAMARADAHCAQFGKVVKVSNFDSLMGSMTFECVAK